MDKHGLDQTRREFLARSMAGTMGFALAGTWSMDRLWVCVLIGWSLKVAVLRYGGVKAYRPAIPFFIGLILGDFIVGALWNLYGIIMEVKVYRFWF